MTTLSRIRVPHAILHQGNRAGVGHGHWYLIDDGYTHFVMVPTGQALQAFHELDWHALANYIKSTELA